ncbi:hypothetical protein CVT24_002929 [Panaeolus cyanescens]|uniref:Uncharacterized protein n=1 Tax=Panaeolus cyanescens TaxID=181874 RepID=A0A409VP34_9AGAR|nr:hypothetical protein CVT24_002929 [Panaeolus cyanescens]
MTPSSKATPSPRTIFNKAVRAEAHARGLTFSRARNDMSPARDGPLLGIHQLGLGPFGFCCNCDMDIKPPHPKGRGRSTYNNKMCLVAAPEVDDGALELDDDDVYDFSVDFVDSPKLPQPPAHTVSLLDLARPAKKRGPAKDFEVVPRVRNVVALEDNDVDSFYVPSTSGTGDDEWERVSDEQTFDNRRSYSSVLRGPPDT